MWRSSLISWRKTHFFWVLFIFARDENLRGQQQQHLLAPSHNLFCLVLEDGGDFLFPSPLRQGQYIHKHLPPSSSSQVVSSKLVVFGHPSFGLFCPFWTGSKFVRCCDRCGSFCAIRLLRWDGRENGPNVPVVGWPAGHTRRALLL